MKITSTKNYKQFKLLNANRAVKVKHVNSLIQSIAEKNMLEQNPIIVNEKMQVIDGQHRLAAAEANDWPISYVVVEKGNIKDVQRLNSTSKVWSALDYLYSYAEENIEPYVTLKDLYETFSPSISTLVQIFSGNNEKNGWKQFKSGEFTFPDYETSRELFENYIALRPFVHQRIFSDRDFVKALPTLLDIVPVEQFIVKLGGYNKQFEPRSTVKDYLREFEEVMNHKVTEKNHIRLF